MALTLERMGVEVEVHHHEVGGPGQAEIDLRFQPLLRMADAMQLYKYVARNVARQARQGRRPSCRSRSSRRTARACTRTCRCGRTARRSCSTPDSYALISDAARHYVGGLLAHAPALLAFCAPTTNSYKRLVPGYEAPVSLLYSKRNRSAAVRIPVYFTSPEGQARGVPLARPEREPVPRVRGAADGGPRRHRARPRAAATGRREPLRATAGAPGAIEQVPDLARPRARRARGRPRLPARGRRVHADLLEAYLEHKRAEVDEVRLRPHPWEFALYLDA